MKYLEGGSTRAAEQGGLKAEVVVIVTRRWAISDEGNGKRQVTTTIWTGPISDDERAVSDMTDPISVTLAIGSWLEPKALLWGTKVLLALSLLFRFALGL